MITPDLSHKTRVHRSHSTSQYKTYFPVLDAGFRRISPRLVNNFRFKKPTALANLDIMYEVTKHKSISLTII
jgi:hypothetical protein